MNDKKIRIALIVSIIPSYREGFYDRLFSRTDMFVKVYCQGRVRGTNIKTIHNKYPDNVRLLSFVGAKREKLTWQFIPWKEVFSNYDVIMVEGNPRNLSHAVLASLMRFSCHPVILWTMAHSFRGNSFSENIRLFWSLIFDFLFVYNDGEVEFLRRRGFGGKYLVGMNNGLDQKEIERAILMWPDERLQEWRVAKRLERSTILLSCARVEAKNGFDQLVLALNTIIQRVPDAVWCLIGDGPEKLRLESMVSAAGLAEHVRFIGELYDETELAPWFLSSKIFVQPSAIGLSIMHAFGYGLPVITHGNANVQGPEYSAFQPGRTGRNYREGDLHDLSSTVVGLLLDDDARAKMRTHVKKIVKEEYNVDIMVERFAQIAKKAFRGHQRNRAVPSESGDSKDTDMTARI